RANNSRLSNGRINDTLGAEAIDEAIGNFECTAIDANILSQAEDGGIPFHFLPDPLADGFEVSELHDSTSCALRLRIMRIHFKCTTIPFSFETADAMFFCCTFGTPYFGLISWHPFSQYTPPAADSGAGMGDPTANSRSDASCSSTSASRFWFSVGLSHFFPFTR